MGPKTRALSLARLAFAIRPCKWTARWCTTAWLERNCVLRCLDPSSRLSLPSLSVAAAAAPSSSFSPPSLFRPFRETSAASPRASTTHITSASSAGSYILSSQESRWMQNDLEARTPLTLQPRRTEKTTQVYDNYVFNVYTLKTFKWKYRGINCFYEKYSFLRKYVNIAVVLYSV